MDMVVSSFSCRERLVGREINLKPGEAKIEALNPPQRERVWGKRAG